MNRWSLRTRLVLTVSIVAIVAIAVVDVATYSSLRGSLFDRLDKQVALVVEQPPPGEDRAPVPPNDGRPGRAPAQQRATPAGTWKGVYRGSFDAVQGGLAPFDEIVAGVTTDTINGRDRPALDLTDARVTALLKAPETVRAEQGGERFRIRARRIRGEDTLIVAVPIADIDSTLNRLVRIELLVSAVAALGVILLALITVRAGLRPLEAITDAASEIAHDGDDGRGGLGRRVPATADPATEVGRLASSLNSMLERIDGSFAAQEASQVRLRRFVADASHELRTPLTSIQGFAELARTRGADMTSDERATALRRVEEESQHLGRLVEDLLLLSRLDEGLPVRAENVDVASIAATAVDAARVIEPTRVIDFESTGPVVVRVDPVRVRQLVDNLLANVRTHAGAEANVTVRVAAVDAGVDITVTDTGVGLDAADHAAATDRFWRADAARTRETGGSGLGLAIVRSLAHAHGGDVTLAPGVDGRGLAVCVSLCPVD